jgi:hypothetical protein
MKSVCGPYIQSVCWSYCRADPVCVIICEIIVCLLVIVQNVIYVFLLYDCMFMYDYPGRFFRAFSSVVRQIPDGARPALFLFFFCCSMYFSCCSMHFLCCSMYFLCCSTWCLFCDVPCTVCVYMCTEQLPPGGYPNAVKYIISNTMKQIIIWK